MSLFDFLWASGSEQQGLLHAPLAQLVEQLTLNQWVQGSSPWRCTSRQSLQRVSVSDAEGPPVPIPNTEVKLCSAENTCLATSREDRSLPTHIQGNMGAQMARRKCFPCIFTFTLFLFDSCRSVCKQTTPDKLSREEMNIGFFQVHNSIFLLSSVGRAPDC